MPAPLHNPRHRNECRHRNRVTTLLWWARGPRDSKICCQLTVGGMFGGASPTLRAAHWELRTENSFKEIAMSEKKSILSRRAFLGRTAALAAMPYLVPASVFGRDGAVPPSERIVLGGIGIGSRGTDDLNWMLPERDVQFVADCDPQKQRREAVKKLVDTRYGNSDCKLYADIREFLATRTDIDAVLSTTGDRWHARQPSWPCGRAKTYTPRSRRP